MWNGYFQVKLKILKNLYNSKINFYLIRYICIEKQHWILKIGPENLTKIILAVQGFITIVGVIIAVIGSDLHGAPMLIPFCKGISYEFFTTIRIYQGDHKYAQIGNILLTFNYLVVQSVLILEIVLYAILFKAFRQSDKKMEGKISASHSKKRFRKNTVNLMGQVVGFAIETVYLFGAILFMFLSKEPQLEGEWGNVSLSVAFF